MEANEKIASVRIHALGALAVTTGAILRYRSRVRARKVQELLMGLVSAGAHGLAGHMLCEALWPESGGDEAYRALAAAVHRLRRTLHCGDAVLFEGGRVALSGARCWVDAWAFEQAVRESFNLNGAAVVGKPLTALPLGPRSAVRCGRITASARSPRPPGTRIRARHTRRR